MSLEEKYGIVYINNKRYYKINMDGMMIMEDAIPYCFVYKDKFIYDSAWNRITVKILEYIDSLNPKLEDELLKLEYEWSKQPVFSVDNRVNFLPFKSIYLNVNHTATHARMNIQLLLKEYGIELSECIMIVRKHPCCEAKEVREYFRNISINSFKKMLLVKGKAIEDIEKIIKNFNVLNQFLSAISPGYNDFFLFDDYYYFQNYRNKTLNYISEKKHDAKVYEICDRYLEYLNDYYRKKVLWDKTENVIVTKLFKIKIKKEIDFLFESLKTEVITASKIYARISILYSDELKKIDIFDSRDNFYELLNVCFSKFYYFKYPFISKSKNEKLSSDQIIISYAYSLEKFNIKMLNDYASKMHLKPYDNYLEFIVNCSDKYVQVDKGDMIEIDTFEISEEQKGKIFNEINYYINSYGKIDSRTYNGYSYLPSLSYEWNAYLLVGIIRTFFKNDFTIEYTANNYDITSFIISKKVSN